MSSIHYILFVEVNQLIINLDKNRQNHKQFLMILTTFPSLMILFTFPSFFYVCLTGLINGVVVECALEHLESSGSKIMIVCQLCEGKNTEKET